MDYRTFNQWSSAGYKIRKGSKATWINGVPMFSEEQVTKSTRWVYDKSSSGYWDDSDAVPDFDPWMGGYF